MDGETQICAGGGSGRTATGALPSGDPLLAATLQLPDAVALFRAHHDRTGLLTDLEWHFVNPAAERLLGIRGLAGQRLRGSGTDAACPGLFETLADALHGPVQRIVAAQCDDAPVRWRVTAGPAPGGVCAVLTDLGPGPSLTELSVETLAAALEHSAESFAVFDHEDRLVHANGRLTKDLPTLADLLVPGVSFEELARSFALADPRLTTEAERAAWLAARLERHRRLESPVMLPLPDGRWLLSREYAVPGGVLVHYTDVTEQKLNEERLRIREAEAHAARNEAESASRAKSAFLAQMSHELRTPLNAVLGFSEMLLSEAFGPLGNPRYRSYAGDIRDAGSHLLALIDDILELSRLDSGGMPMAEEGVDLDALSLRVVSALREAAAEGEVRMRREIPSALPLLQGDAQALTQMLTNLLSNAVTHTPPGGEVILTGHLMPDGGIGLMVADTGVGIPTADLPRILHPLEPPDSTIARNSRGTGLGLPIVKRLVEMHGGRLELTSQPGVGTAVVLIFPAVRSLPRGRCRPSPLPAIILPH